MRGFVLIPLALFIDGFQALLMLSLSAVAAFPGTTGGCAVGGYYGGEFGCLVLGALGSIPIVNGIIATVTIPVGILVGFVVSLCLSFMFAGIFSVLLLSMGLFKGRYVWTAMLGESLPGLSILPAWTGCIVMVLINDARERKQTVSKATVLARSPSVGQIQQQQSRTNWTAARGVLGKTQNISSEGASRNEARSSTRVPLLNTEIQPRARGSQLGRSENTYGMAA